VRFDRVRLENFKCYEEADVELDEGVTVIHGLNGSGKSSLLEACFFALYGATALEKTLEEVVTIGREETIVELWFTHAGGSYHIRRRVRATGDSARTATCVLESPDGTIEGAIDVRQRIAELLRMDSEAFVNCAYVRQGEVNKLINASPSDRQDMIDDLLQLGKLEEYRERASDARVGVGRVRDDTQGALSEVKEQIATKEAQNLHATRNELTSELGEVESEIDRFEKNRAQARETRDGAASVLEEYEEKRDQLDAIEDDITELRERVSGTEREREQLADSIESAREELSAARERRDDLLERAELSADATDAGEKSTLDPSAAEELEPEQLTDRVEERIDALRAEVDDVTERIRELSVRKQEHDSDRETRIEGAEELEAGAEEKREEAAELESEVADARDLLAEKRDELAELGARIEEKRGSFADAPVAFGEAAEYRETVADQLGECRERRAECEADLESASERLAEAEELREEGRCPECGQPVEGSPHVDAIDERRERVAELEERLAELEEQESELEADLEQAETLVERESTVERLETERENLQELLAERERGVEEKGERAETLREEAAEHGAEAETLREKAAEAAEQAGECQAAIAERNREKADLQERIDRLAGLAEAVETVTTLEDDVATLRAQRAEKEELNDERRDRLAEKRERRADLREAFDEERVEEAREQKENAEAYLDKVEGKLTDLDERRSELQSRIGGVESELAELEGLRERRESLAATVGRLDSLYDEARSLQEMYGDLRAELRQRNVESLERMLNETFELLYENDTYSRIELDGEYRLTVYQKDGEALDPEQLSGGERALFNLSLRCAIYQLLAEGIEGTAPMPPLILDEPTVFLDAGHVSQLVDLVDAMRDLGVAQILVVSHDEELVAAADDLVTVRKDPTTNRSTVERDGLDERALAEAD
jgi:exonuclease SbcC